MKITLSIGRLGPIVALVALAACNQQAAEPTADEIAVCEALDGNVVELQKRHSAELGEALLMRQLQAQGQLDAAAGDPAELARFTMLHYEGRLNNLLVLLEGNDCDVPDEPVDGVIYSQAAGQCLQARASGNPAAETLCEPDDWEPNEDPDAEEDEAEEEAEDSTEDDAED